MFNEAEIVYGIVHNTWLFLEWVLTNPYVLAFLGIGLLAGWLERKFRG